METHTGYNKVSTGLQGLDSIMDGLRLGDNVVWQVDSVEDYQTMVDPYLAQARRDGRHLVYIRFGSHRPMTDDLTGITVYDVDPAGGFEHFATEIHRAIAAEGLLAFYVFDSLTELLDVWHSDLMVMNFFKVTCPFLYELDTIAYFALIRGRHTSTTIAGIRETTQLLLDLYRIEGATYVHPLKVWQRYSPTMFFPHLVTEADAVPITSSAATASLFGSIAHGVEPPEHWRSLVDAGWQALDTTPEEQQQAKALLLSVMFGRSGRMVELSDEYLTLADVLAVATREIGTGYVGGKTVGMLTARAILEHAADDRFSARLEPHDSYYLGSDLFFTYIIANDWWKLWNEQKTPEGYLSAGAELHQKLAEGRFPPAIRDQFLRMLEYFGQSPIIVRSSSLLEDNFGNAFAGKYESVFCCNQGTPEERHRAFEDAVRTVYASAMSPAALTYRKNRGLAERDEQMAILVQRVSGDHHGTMFFPHAAGVGNSSNLYVWDPSIDPEAGMVRLVFGLGTRAVDRTLHDYVRIVPLDNPARAPLTDPDDPGKYSQRNVDVLSLASDEPETVSLASLLDTSIKADWGLFTSTDHALLRRLRELRRPLKPVPRILDFNRLLTETDFAAMMRDILSTISSAYDYPVDIEFTLNVEPGGGFKVNLVQCRPLQTRGLGAPVAAPTPVDPDECLLATTGHFMGGNVRLPLDWVLLVRPDAYLALPEQQSYSVARQIGVLNRRLSDAATMLLGPGRWGTSTPGLGVPVHFAEICNATVLGEFTYAAGAFRPELSYGSHFFQDLVESGIFYLALFEDLPGVVFHPEWVLERPNALTEILPEASGLAEVLHLVRADGLILHADIGTQRLVCG